MTEPVTAFAIKENGKLLPYFVADNARAVMCRWLVGRKSRVMNDSMSDEEVLNTFTSLASRVPAAEVVVVTLTETP